MRRLLKKLTKYLVYLGAGLIILLAVGVGLFRLFLPRLPEYQDEIKNWASAAIGVQVEFSEMDARWRLRGPELNFHDAELVSRDDLDILLRAEEVSVGVGLMRLLRDREWTAERILIRDATIDVSVDDEGAWHVQGVPVDEFPGFGTDTPDDARPLTFVGEDIRFEFGRADLDEPVTVDVDRVEFRRDELQQGFEASLALPASLGDRLHLAASRRLSGSHSPWQIFLEGDSLQAAGWSRLAPADWPRIGSGVIDLSLWLDISDRRVRSATANFLAEDIAAGREPGHAPFTAEGRLEFSNVNEGWLLAADNLTVTTDTGSWPESTLQVSVSDEDSGSAETIAGNASYVRLDDLHYVLEWLPEQQRALLEHLAPAGEVRDLNFSRSGAAPLAGRFNLSAAMERVSINAHDGWPGISGFSGAIRADQSGGRLEMEAGDLAVDLPDYLDAPIVLDRALGTVIWRRNERGTTFLSDSIDLSNAEIQSDTSLQVILPADDQSPVVDVQSRWSVRDIGSIGPYLPASLIKPALYRWLNDALVTGRVSQGTLHLAGPLDQFPFDDGNGTFRVEAALENAVFRYSDLWPAAEDMTVDVVVEKTRLYSVENTATNAGNRVVDARIEIPDLRTPVLSMEAHATGTLETIRRFSRESPIAGVFGGHLDRVETEGDASFDLLLNYPILDRDNYDFTTVIQSSNGTVRIDGLAAPITELNGQVRISRDSIGTETLTGRFLGDPVSIDLLRAADDSPYSVIATARGTVGHQGLADHLGVPFAELLAGSTAYDAIVRFPRPGAAVRTPFQVEIESDLRGMAVQLPSPVGKPADSERSTSISIAFPETGRIASYGSLSDEVHWNLDFAREGSGWDFERGTLTVGEQKPGEAQTRGLHIAGEVPVLDFDAWLALGRMDGEAPGFGDRIRSVDLVVDDLTVLGQQLAQHHVVVNRSAFDWAVQISGDDVVGSITVPYDFSGDRPLILDMEKLMLPAADEDAEPGQPAAEQRRDPRSLPRVTVRADAFALGTRRFGNLRADFLKTDAGLEAAVETGSDSFFMTGRAGWIVDDNDVTGQRTFLDAQLISSNVEQTLRELDYLAGIESESLLAQFDLSWSGGPGEDFLGGLDGSVSVEFGTGQLDDVEPGAGRVFGLMSVVALPRRLSLDFRDVFDRGFGFDGITGTFRLVDGEAYTCDLSLKGPAADVGIVGRTGLVDKQYEQSAVVSANVGNTLPVVGAVVAGPQVAAALLIFSQIFKKPLQEMGQIYYAIQGTWDEPAIDAADARNFAATSALAGCLERAD